MSAELPEPQVLARAQLADLAELVRTGPVDLGAFTQAEMAVVIGEVPALAGVQDAVLAEAVRSLAARGVLHRVPGEDSAEVVGDLGLLVALVSTSTGTLDIRRGHDGPAEAPWRWLVSLFAHGLVGVDRIDALGLHRLSLYSRKGVADQVAQRMIDGRARIVAGTADPVPIDEQQVRVLATTAQARWQLVHRVPRRDTGTMMVVDSLVVRTDEARVDLITPAPDSSGYERRTTDEAHLSDYLTGLFTVT